MKRPSQQERSVGRRGTNRNETGTGRRKTSPITKPGEKLVQETEATVPLAPPPKPGPRARKPKPPAAVDRRKQFSGTDEHAR